jgi:hypothetical protein
MMKVMNLNKNDGLYNQQIWCVIHHLTQEKYWHPQNLIL